MTKITLIGYGKMGKAIENLANDNNIIIENKVKESNSLKETRGDICIDFTSPDAFTKNYKTISENFKNVVIGTTGWEKNKSEILDYFKLKKNNVIYGSNFSIGMNIFFLISELAAKSVSNYPEYSIHISEKHHNQKKDRPSGSAITLKDLISKYKKVDDISSIRSGTIKGIHEIEINSEDDSIILEHRAYSRNGFAIGALQAAKWIQEINGIFEFKDIIENKILKNE